MFVYFVRIKDTERLMKRIAPALALALLTVA